MFELIQRLFGKDATCSKDVAKDRLRLVLVHDRVNTSPQFIEGLKDDMIKVISKYMDIDEETMEVHFAKTENSVALIANIPVNRMKRGNMPRE
jgi:cell division topological specificity factor